MLNALQDLDLGLNELKAMRPSVTRQLPGKMFIENHKHGDGLRRQEIETHPVTQAEEAAGC